MQTQFFQITNTLNKYRTMIIALLALAILIALLIAPSVVVSAGKAVSTGG